jgi:hypothetical protein
MALNPAVLKTSLLFLYQACSEGEGLTVEEFAEQMSTIIDAYIKTATVTVTVTSVSGVMTGPGVSGPGSGTGVIS